MLIRFLLSAFILVYGVSLPIYWSYKAINANSPVDMKKWLAYWISFTLFTRILGFLEGLPLLWIPFYHEIVLLLIIFLATPYMEGSTIIYESYIKPFLKEHEVIIDEQLKAISTNGFRFIFGIVNTTAINAFEKTKKWIAGDRNISSYNVSGKALLTTEVEDEEETCVENEYVEAIHSSFSPKEKNKKLKVPKRPRKMK